MKILRKSADRGMADHGWLKAAHTFSFADYYDPQWMGFHGLRVINEDRIAAGQGFGTHGHANMEIITYVIAGELGHQDSMGNNTPVRPGEIQYMSAGSGVRHSEFNHSKTEPIHLLQIWIEPAVKGGAPRYSQVKIPEEQRAGKLALLAAGESGGGLVTIRQDAALYNGIFAVGQSVTLPLRSGRAAWVQLVRGELLVNGERLTAGDAIGLKQEAAVELVSDKSEAEVLVFDLPQ